MLRLAYTFATIAVLGVVMLVAALSGMETWPESTILPFALTVAVGWVLVQDWGYRRLIDRRRPPSDIPRLKAYLETNGARVTSVMPAGVAVGGRSGPDWRRYVAQVRLPDGSEVSRTIGVQVTLLGSSSVRDYDHPRKTDYFAS